MLYFSDQLPQQYPSFFKDLESTLNQMQIDFSLIQGTKDIWCRDYMPVCISGSDHVRFKYEPDYLIESPELRTNNSELSYPSNISIKTSDLNIDGGNIIQSENKVILTDKIFLENPKMKESDILRELSKIFDPKKVVIIPKLPYDQTGHADGMIRFIDEETVLISDFETIYSESWNKRFKSILEEADLKSIILPYYETLSKNKDGICSAEGCYINFIIYRDYILLPTFENEAKNEKAMLVLAKHFPSFNILRFESTEIAKEGGVLNCISWSI